MKEFLLKSELELPDAAKWFLDNMNSSTIYAFSGEMGAGKTTLIKAICKELGVEENVSSPSFALVYEYSSPQSGAIYHFDLYRVKEVSELYDLGYEDYFYSDKICFIEWPEIAEDLLPSGTIRVNIIVQSDNSRKITITG